MFRNAFAYITRKWSKSLLLLTIILLMSTLSLLGLAMRSATQEAASKSLGAITNSFSMQINRNTNPGTPRGAGNLKGEDIKKISETKGIVSTIKPVSYTHLDVYKRQDLQLFQSSLMVKLQIMKLIVW